MFIQVTQTNYDGDLTDIIVNVAHISCAARLASLVDTKARCRIDIGETSIYITETFDQLTNAIDILHAPDAKSFRFPMKVSQVG